MTAQAEMDILNLYKGQPLSKAVNALEIMKAFHAQKACELRCRLAGMTIRPSLPTEK